VLITLNHTEAFCRKRNLKLIQNKNIKNIKMETNKKIIYLVIGLVVIGGIGFGVYKIIKNKKEQVA